MNLSDAIHAVTPPLRLSRRTLIAVIFSVGYAFFVVFFPWGEISKAGFSDFDNYVEFYSYVNTQGKSVVEFYQLSTLIQYFTHEVLWFELVRWLTRVTGDVATGLHIISFFILLVWGFFLLKRVSYGVALLFLFNPSAIDVAMSGIRNGLAWSLVIVGLNVESKIVKAGLFLIALFVHSSTLALLAIYYSTELAVRFIKDKKILLAGGLGVGVCMGLMLTVGSQFVLGAIGDRHAGANYVVGGGSFLQASLWGILLYLQSASGRDYIRQNIFSIAVLAWYQTMNPFIPWSYRIWSSFLPMIAFSAMNLPARKRQTFLYLYSVYLVAQYLYWTKIFDYWYPALTGALV